MPTLLLSQFNQLTDHKPKHCFFLTGVALFPLDTEKQESGLSPFKSHLLKFEVSQTVVKRFHCRALDWECSRFCKTSLLHQAFQKVRKQTPCSSLLACALVQDQGQPGMSSESLLGVVWGTQSSLTEPNPCESLSTVLAHQVQVAIVEVAPQKHLCCEVSMPLL